MLSMHRSLSNHITLSVLYGRYSPAVCDAAQKQFAGEANTGVADLDDRHKPVGAARKVHDHLLHKQIRVF